MNKMRFPALLLAALSVLSTSGCGQPAVLPEEPCLIDLHLHLDGAITPELALTLAKMQGDTLPTEDPQALLRYLQVPKEAADLTEYLRCFELPCSLMQTKETLSEAVYRVQENLLAQGYLYAELRFAPQLHTLRGLTQEQVVAAALEGLSRSKLNANLILCCMRLEGNEAANHETLELAKEYLGKGVVALDLAGAEAQFPAENYTALFARAKELAIPFTLHAGEAAGPESVRAAVALGAARIGHGVRASEDAEVMELLARQGIPVELCPKSNLDTKVYASLADYPLETLLKNGVPVTINTDNPTVSATTLREELTRLQAQFSLSRAQLKRFSLCAAEHSFADTALKEELKRKLEKAWA